MKFLQLAAFLAYAGYFTSAHPSYSNEVRAVDPNSEDPHERVDWEAHPFQAPGPDDSRGPCPAFNSLANHGFINRNGKNVTMESVIDAMKVVFNVNPKLSTPALKIGILASSHATDFDTIQSIALPGNLEHDASISREDYAVGNHIVFNETLYQDLATSNPGFDYYDPVSAGVVQKIGLERARRTNPKLRNTVKDFMIRCRVSTFYLSVMGDPITGRAPKKFVDIWFREERLPLEEGWRVPQNEMTPATDYALKQIIIANSDWTPEPNQYPWFVLGNGAPIDPYLEGDIFPVPK